MIMHQTMVMGGSPDGFAPQSEKVSCYASPIFHKQVSIHDFQKKSIFSASCNSNGFERSYLTTIHLPNGSQHRVPENSRLKGKL